MFSKPKKIVQKNPQNFYDCVYLVYIFSRIFGLLPFSICYDANRHIESVRVGIFDALCFIGAISLNLMLVYFTISLLNNSNPVQSAILVTGGRMILVIGLVNASLSITLDLLNRKRLLKISKDFFTFDTEVIQIIVNHLYIRL